MSVCVVVKTIDMKANMLTSGKGTILVTGSAGFIGSNVAYALLKLGVRVVGIDNLNEYYDVGLKKARLERLEHFQSYRHFVADMSNMDDLISIYSDTRPDVVIHMAAQPGVRYAVENPQSYINSNIIGFFNLLEAIRRHGTDHFLFASSSSVYGNNTNLPYSEHDSTDEPLNLYAATKKADEAMAYSYAHMYGIPTTALRFFTVYGPWGRPDMTPYSFTKAIVEETPIKLFNYGNYKRSFTYIDDIVEWVVRLIEKAPLVAAAHPQNGNGHHSYPATPYQLFNLGHDDSIDMVTFTRMLEKRLNKSAIIDLLPPQPGEIFETRADIGRLVALTGYEPQTTIEDGLDRVVEWYVSHVHVDQNVT
jgi:UDP-glucuronate 4-epimerase